jgi:hypothetical protein
VVLDVLPGYRPVILKRFQSVPRQEALEAPALELDSRGGFPPRQGCLTGRKGHGLEVLDHRKWLIEVVQQRPVITAPFSQVNLEPGMPVTGFR